MSGRFAQRLGAALTVAGLLNCGGSVQPGAPLTSNVETGIANCTPANSGNQCALVKGAINLRSVARLTRAIPAPVEAGERSVVGLLAFSTGPQAIGKSFYASTGYVIKDSHGQNVVRSAAHAMDTSGLVHPAFETLINVAGKLRTVPVAAIQRPRDYSSQAQVGDANNTDVSQAIIPERGWISNIHAPRDANVYVSVNDFASLRPIPEEEGRLPIGTILYDEGLRGPGDEFLVPPDKPEIEPMVVAGYLKGAGDRVVLIPEDQSRTIEDWSTDSGSALVTAYGSAFATQIVSGQSSAEDLLSQLGVSLAGYAMSSTVKFETATLNSASTLQDLNNATPLQEPIAYLP
jgi:hypothetical protein